MAAEDPDLSQTRSGSAWVSRPAPQWHQVDVAGLSGFFPKVSVQTQVARPRPREEPLSHGANTFVR